MRAVNTHANQARKATVAATPPELPTLPPANDVPKPRSVSASRIAGSARNRRKPVTQRFCAPGGSISTSIG